MNEIIYNIVLIIYQIIMIVMIYLWDLPGDYWFWYFAVCFIGACLVKFRDTKGVTHENI